MKKFFVFLTLFFLSLAIGQENRETQLLKDSLYTKYRLEVINYSMKDFSELFLEFHQKTGANNVQIISKEAFYTYTIKIAIFSDRYAKLYPKEKEEAMKNKEEWLKKTYEEYLKTK